MVDKEKQSPHFRGLLYQAWFYAFSFVFLYAALLTQISEQTRHIEGKSFFIQPYFWPGVSLIFGLLMAFFMLLKECLRLYKAAALQSSFLQSSSYAVDFKEIFRILEYILWFLTYTYSINYLGYLPATLIILMGLSYRVGYRGWKWMGIAAGTAFTIVVIFKSFLKISLPAGAVYEFLPEPLRTFFNLYF